MKKNKKPLPLIERTQFVLHAFSIVMIATLLSISAILWSQYRIIKDSQKNDTSEIEAMIFSAVDGLTRPLPLDAKSGEAYIHDALIMFPATVVTPPNDFRFNYQSASGDFPEQVTIAYSPMIEREKAAMRGKQTVEESLQYVPNVQACARGYRLYFKTQDEHKYELVFEKTLRDGRMVYVYKEKACIEDNHDEIVDYLKQIESY